MIEGLYNYYVRDKFVSFDESMNRKILQNEVKDLVSADFSKRIQDCKRCLLSHQRYSRDRNLD